MHKEKLWRKRTKRYISLKCYEQGSHGAQPVLPRSMSIRSGGGLRGAKRDSVLCQLSLPSRFFYCLKILKPHTHARAPNPHLPLVMHEVVELHLPNILHVDLIFILLYTCPTVSGSYVAG